MIVSLNMRKLVQVNLNRQRRSNDLFLQFMRERSVALAVVSEPNSVPEDPGWAASTDGLAAITWRWAERNLECSVMARREGFCLVSWAELYVCSCYFSPNQGVDEFRDWLNELSVIVSPYLDASVMVLGDFNVRSLIWDTAANDRGNLLADMMVGLGFHLLNESRVSTTFHPRDGICGGPIVGLWVWCGIGPGCRGSL